jgi:segregation and condensation protein B
METLAIIAYKQPITRAGIEFIRGVDSSHTIRRLMQQKLVRIVGREMLPGRPGIYGTTKNFLEIFGLTNLKYLPTLSELDMEKLPGENQLELPLEEDSE